MILQLSNDNIIAKNSISWISTGDIGDHLGIFGLAKLLTTNFFKSNVYTHFTKYPSKDMSKTM